jgi:hypothetical protein
MRLRIDLGEGVPDDAVRPDHVGDPARVLVPGGVAGAVGEAERPVGVAQQRERKVEFPGERRVFRDAVERGSQDDDIAFLELGGQVAVPATFPGSPRGVGLGVEPQHHVPAPEVGQGDVPPLVVLRGEVRSLLADG